ncbi:MAG: hypothetical protein WC718_04575 [Phycisphaerales bacterium]
MSLLQLSTFATKTLSSKTLGVSVAAGVLAVLQGCTVVQERRVYVPVERPPERVVVYQTPRDNPPVGIPASANTVIYQPPPEVVYEPAPVVVYQPSPVVVYQPSPVVVYEPEPVVTYVREPACEPIFSGSIFVGSGYRGSAYRHDDHDDRYRGGRDDHRNDRSDDRRDRDDHSGPRGRNNDHRDDHRGDSRGNQNNDRGNDRDQGNRGDRGDRGHTAPPPAPRQDPPPPRRNPDPPRSNPPVGPAPRPAPAPSRVTPGGSPLLAQAARDTQANRAKANSSRNDQKDSGGDPGKSARRGGSPLVPR